MTTTTTAHVLNLLLSYQASVKMMHWMTSTYGHHRALDDLHAALGAHGDRLAETLLAITPLPPPLSRSSSSKGSAAAAGAAAELQAKFANLYTPRQTTVATLTAMHDHLVGEVRPRLPDESARSILDDIVNAVRTCMYLCAMVL